MRHACVMRLDGIHHVTYITGDAPRNVDFYTGTPRPAAGEEDGQPGRPDRLPPLLRRRAGQPRRRHHVLRVPGRRAGPRGRRDGAHRRLARRLRRRRSTSGPSGSASSATARRRFADPEGLRHELVVATRSRRAARSPTIPEIPRELALQGFEGVRAYARDVEVRTAPFLDALGFERDGNALDDARRLARRLDRVRRRRPTSRASPAPARCTTSRGRRRWTSTRRGGSASPRPAAARRRSSTASGSARSTSASRAACCSRSRRSGPGFATDEDPAHLGEKLILPPAFEHLRAQVEPMLTPLPNPRGAGRAA